MRWVCFHYPQLPLEIAAAGAEGPCAVVEPKGNRKPLTFVNAAARLRGIHSGASQSSATGLVPDLRVLGRNRDAEDVALQALACRAYGFGSPVVLDELSLSVWVEVERSISMFQGWKNLAKALVQPAAHLPYEVRIGSAPTLSAAFLLARVSEKPRRAVARLQDLPTALSPLPVAALPFDGDALQVLSGSGLRTIGEVLALPVASLGKRLGKPNLLALQRLLGQVPEVWEAWLPATQYRRRFEFDEPIETTEGLLFPLRIGLAEFVSYLKARDLAIQHFQLRLIDSRKRVLIHPIGLLSATRDPKRLLLILREQLDRIELEDGLLEVVIEADQFAPASAIQDDLFSDVGAQVGERFTELQERLSARLGPGAVRQLAVSPDRRPEATQSTDPVQKAVTGQHHPERPLWLLQRPQRTSVRRVLTPPERIELGWWDTLGPQVQRDYFLGEDDRGRMCWLFREPGSTDWKLHGLWQ